MSEKPIINGDNKEDFLNHLKNWVQKKGFYGLTVPTLPQMHQSLSLEQILRLQIIMGETPERIGLGLELGADATEEKNGISMLDLIEAYSAIYGRKSKKLFELFEKHGVTSSSRIKRHPSKG